MPAGAAAGFDTLFGISARTFGAMVEGRLRPVVFALGPPIPVTGGTLNFDDLRVEAWFGTTVGNTVEIRIGLHNASFTPLVGAVIPFGPDWSDFFVPATIASGAAGAGFVDLTLTFNFNQTRFDADDEAPLQAAGLTEALIATLLGPAMTDAGFPNPVSLTSGAFIPVVPLAPAAAAGVPPGVSVVAVAVQRRPAAGAPGEEAVAILFTFQNRPNTPAVVAAGNPAALGPSSFAVGQDLLLNIANRFLFELLASLALESPVGLGVPVASVAATAAGITLIAPAPVVLGGTAGTLSVFTLGAPAVGTTILPLAVTFLFTADFIDYTVTIAGATMTVGLAGGGIVIGSTIPPAVVTFVVPWWVTVIRILGGFALGLLTGNIAIAVVAAVAGGLSVVAEGLIVSAIAGPTAVGGIAGATGGLGGGLIPPAVAALAGGAVLTPPIVFDDLQAGGRSTLADPIKVVRRVAAEELRSGGQVNLDEGSVSHFLTGFGHKGSTVKGADLAWDDAFGLGAISPARMVTLSGTFSSIGYSDVSSALQAGSVSSLPISAVPLVSATQISAGILPAGLFLGVQTNRGRLAKVVAWRESKGLIVLRYIVWDASQASVRLFPANPIWNLTGTQRAADTPATGDQPLMHHSWSSHAIQLTALTHRMSGPMTFSWTLDGVPLVGSGSGVIAGASVSWTVAGATLTLNTDMGESLDHAELVCDAVDANGLRESDSAQMTVVGRHDHPASPYEGALVGVREKVRDAMRHWVDSPPQFDGGVPPEPLPDDVGIEVRIRVAIRMADPHIDVDSIRIR
jgi:hypothetical protein